MVQPLETREIPGVPQEHWRLDGRSIKDLISEAEQTGKIYFNLSAKDILRQVTPSTDREITTIMPTLENIIGHYRLEVPEILKRTPLGLTECPPEVSLLKTIKDAKQNSFEQFYQYYLAMNPINIGTTQQVLWTELREGKLTIMGRTAYTLIPPGNRFMFRVT